MPYHKALTHADPTTILSPLFEQAKAVDEFEFCCTLLRLRGAESAGWDPLLESDTLAKQLLAVMGGPIESGFRVRLLLFLYCHLTEMRDFYNIVGNLLRVCVGERYSMAPFGVQPFGGKKRPLSPAEKIRKIVEWAAEADQPAIGEMFQELLVREVRNAFFHSDYILTQESFNISDGAGVNIDNLISPKVEYSWLMPRLELGINAALATVDLTLGHIRSYRADKVVSGRLSADGSYTDIQLTTDAEFGLVGFRTPPRADLLPNQEGGEVGEDQG